MKSTQPRNNILTLPMHVLIGKIKNKEQESLNEQFKRSGSIYDSQTSLNAMSAEIAVNDEIRKLLGIETFW